MLSYDDSRVLVIYLEELVDNFRMVVVERWAGEAVREGERPRGAGARIGPVPGARDQSCERSPRS